MKKIQDEIKYEMKQLPDNEIQKEDKICCYGKDCLNLIRGICTLEHKEKCTYAEKCLNYAKDTCPLQH